MFIELIEQVLAKGIAVTRVLADGGYDTYENFDLLRGKDIEAGIKIADDATMHMRGHRSLGLWPSESGTLSARGVGRFVTHTRCDG